ncbi:MAG TPA: hypothetical protein VLH60_05125 [Sedimentisphaerales bacterium]|nr:hypothetical protein [Sedimentisphaerales bacterium]
MIETIAGGLLGGIFRIVPEILKWLDRKDERKHELSMQKEILAFQRLKGDQKIDEIVTQGQQDWNIGALDALKSAIEAQARPSGVRWIDGFNALIRPLMALQWVLLLYPAVIVASFILAVESGTPPLAALIAVFGPEEKAFTAGIANFWILNRVFANVHVGR